MDSTGVSIAILTYRRPHHLQKALAAANKQDGPLVEILVVDNASDPSLAKWISENYPRVRYIPMGFNAGCAGRNVALKLAAAPLVITIDDDVELIGSNCVTRVSEKFTFDPSLGCLNFRITDSNGNVLERDWCHPRPITDAANEFETYFILEGACALRRDAVLNSGGYPENFFIGCEGVDLAYRMLDAGWKIFYTPEISVVHYAAPEQRPSWRPYFYYTRNGIWICYRYFGLPRALGHCFEHILKMGFFAMRAGHVRSYLRGIWAGIKGLKEITRTPLTTITLKRLSAIRAHDPSFLERLNRHLQHRIL